MFLVQASPSLQQSKRNKMAGLTNFLALAASAMSAYPAMVSSMTLQSESSPMVYPFMTVTMVLVLVTSVTCILVHKEYSYFTTLR
jgi:preprotein translocase subunit SecY